MKITVIGAGSIGAAVTRHLCAHTDDVSQVQVCDTHASSLQKLHDQTDAPVLRSFQADARDTNVIDQIIRGSDCVISCVPPELNPELAELCVHLGINFCDLGGNDQIVNRELALDEQAREKSIWVVPNCGLAPGLINVLCMRGLAQFDTPQAAHLRVGDVPLEPQPPFNFRISWSAQRILDDYTNPAQHLRGGTLTTVDALSGAEDITFDPPFEGMQAFCTQGGLSTLAESLAGTIETFDHKTIRWPGHLSQMQFVLGLGLAEDRKIGVQTHLTYRDVLVRKMRDRLGGVYKDAVLLRVVLHGEKDGAPHTLVYEMAERFNDDTHETAMMRSTAIPAIASALLIARRDGAVTGGGAGVLEDVVPLDAFYDMVCEQGLGITERWHEGFVDVATARPMEQA
ncbi:saccharopine dehydrogenase family protein [Salisaeta longa]|uniref:saccharopine dehydrogenase family protein n=1 Tax=Salisaeta longa TaxID=503170 RepID=UPI000427A38F|nr:saccharopine dehydrogenase C-terminal domain-containing protein [Salisaeta longa]